MTRLKDELHEVWQLGGLSITQLVKRVAHEIVADDITGYAAQLAYYFLFSLFPFLLFLTALLGYVPIPNLMEKIMALVGAVLPGAALQLMEDNVRELITNQKSGLLSFGILVALWSASSAISAISDALNRAYGVKEGRPYWKVQGTAILLTLGLAFFAPTAMILLIFGPQIGGFIAGKVGLGSVFHIFWEVVRWPVILFFLTFTMALLYYFTPDVEQDWKWITPGAVFTVIGWILVSLGFGFYVDHFGAYNKTYGTIGAVIILLTWMYLSGMLLLIGGEINAEIEHASASGKDPGEKKVHREN